MEANLGTGYRYKGDNYQIVPHDFVKMSPGVAMVTTGEDMGKFMLALLSGGVVDGTRIMAEETADTLLRRQVGISPQIPGRSYAFWENSYSGRQVLTHEGNGIGFSNVIALAPEQNFGLYIVANHQVFDKGASPSAAYRFILSLRAAVVEEFLPETEGKTLGQPLPDAAERTSRYAGHYQPTNFSQTDFFKLARLTDAFDVKDNGDGTINIGSKSYIEIEPQVFQSVDYPDLIWSFVENDQGEVEFLTLGRGASYQKAAWYENANFHKVLVGVTALLFLSMLIVWPFTRQGHWVILVVSLLDLIVLVGFGVLMFNANIIVWYKTIPLGLRLLQSLPWVSGLLSLSLPVFLVAKWKDSDASWWGRMHYLLVTLASYAFFWFANFWKLVLK